MSAKQSRAAWTRLIKKVYEADPLSCFLCHNPMKAIAVITDPAQVFKILPPPHQDRQATSRSGSRLLVPERAVCPSATDARGHPLL